MFKKKCNIIILSGGFGTRLGKLTKVTPKPLIKFKQRPFLQYLIEYLSNFGFYKFYLATYYKNNKFEAFKKNFLKEKKDITIKKAIH
jgi:NDP-sugar pyrophosphorylase family protein